MRWRRRCCHLVVAPSPPDVSLRREREELLVCLSQRVDAGFTCESSGPRLVSHHGLRWRGNSCTNCGGLALYARVSPTRAGDASLRGRTRLECTPMGDGTWVRQAGAERGVEFCERSGRQGVAAAVALRVAVWCCVALARPLRWPLRPTSGETGRGRESRRDPTGRVRA